MRGVSSGTYVLAGQGSEENAPIQAQEEVTVGEQDVDGMVLVFRKFLEISGTVPQSSGFAVNLESIGPGSSAGDVVNAQGNFKFNVPPGSYRINVSRPPGSYVKSIKLGDQDVSSGRIELTQAGGKLTILLGTDVGQLEGSVVNENGEPAANAIVTMAPGEELQDRPDLFYQLTADPQGKFDYRDLAPGDYKVLAWDMQNADQSMLQAAEFRKAFDSRAASVNIQPGGHASVQLKLIPWADIEAEQNKLP
jgi:hypothetical protein